MTEAAVCRWAKGRFRRTEVRPNENSGLVKGAPGETWYHVNAALHNGDRGLPGGATLPRQLLRCMGPHVLDFRVIPAPAPPRRRMRTVREWVRLHRERKGR